MLKIGDILWTFCRDNYFVGEISSLSLVTIGYYEQAYYFVSTNGIIGEDQRMVIPATADFNTLVKMQNYSSVTMYHTVSESVAVNYIREHFNETDKTFNEDLIIN